jgi:ubiquitin C-terminal hydrolase
MSNSKNEKYFMVDAGIVRKVIDSIEDKKDYIQIVMGILGAIKNDVYANIKIEITIDDNSVTINGTNIGYKIDTQKSVYLIASDLFYHVTQLISGNAIENVTITDTNMFETIKEDLTDDVKKVVNNYDPHKILGDQVPQVSQQSMQVPSFIPRDDKQLFIGRVCELMNKYGDKLPISTEPKCLANSGNKGCINTGMQCLNACPEFVAWLMYLKDNVKPQSDEDAKLIENLIHIFNVMRGNIELDDNKIKTIHEYIKFPPASTYSGYDFIVGVVNRLEKITITNNTTTISSIIFNLRDSKHNNSQFIEKEIKMESILNSIVNSYNDFSFDLTKNMSSPTCIIMFELQECINKNKTDLGSMRTRLIENVTLNIGEDDNEYKYDYELVAMSMFNPSIGECDLAYAKHDNKWWEFNDEHVKSIDTFESIDGTLFPSTLFYRLKYSCPSPVSQQSTHRPSSIPATQKSSQQTAHREAKQQNDQSLQAPFVCKLMNEYGTKLPITTENKGLAQSDQLRNTCYLNTAMQCLNACPEFVAWLMFLKDKVNPSSDEEANLIDNLIHVFDAMRGNTELDASKITTIQTDLGLQPGNQDCSANFINLLINELETISKSIDVSSIISNIIIPNLRTELASELHMEGILKDVLTSQNLTLSCIIMFNINDPKTTTTNPIRLSYMKNNKIESLELNIDEHTYNYELVAMSMHSPSDIGGHYVAYAKHNDAWWQFNDATVSNNVTFSSITDEFNPTVLFYRLKYTCPSLTGSRSG